MKTFRRILLAASALAFCSDGALAQSAGVVSLTARIAANGTVNFGSGVQSATRDSIGVYTVTFSRSVSNCNYFAALHLASAGQITTQQVSANQVRVRTFNASGGPRDAGISLMVNCAS
jgi:hypothetical protein